MHFQIITPSRLHMGLIDLNGQLGRVDGGFGMALDFPRFVIDFSDEVEGINIEGTHEYLPLIPNLIARLETQYNLQFSNFTLKSWNPFHPILVWVLKPNFYSV